MAKFVITLKDPDGLYDGLLDATETVLVDEGIPKHRKEYLRDVVHNELYEFIKKWIHYGDFITLEFDTETKTVKVIPTDV